MHDVVDGHVNFDGRVATRVDDFACEDRRDRTGTASLLRESGANQWAGVGEHLVFEVVVVGGVVLDWIVLFCWVGS